MSPTVASACCRRCASQARARSVEAVDAAVVLLVEPVGIRRVEAHAVGVMAVVGVGLGQEDGLDVLVEGAPVLPAVGALEDPARRQAQVEVVGVAGVDDDRVQHRAVGGVLLGVLRPGLPHRVVVPAVDRRPGVTGVFTPEQALRAAAGVPDARARRRGPGVSQNTLRRLRPRRSPVWNAGGRDASDQVAPKSVVRNSVGPRWPVPAASSSVRPSRGSSTACWTMWPRKCGPSTDHDRRSASAKRIQAPLRVPRKRAVESVTGATVVMAIGPCPWSELIGQRRVVARSPVHGCTREPPHPRAGGPLHRPRLGGPAVDRGAEPDQRRRHRGPRLGAVDRLLGGAALPGPVRPVGPGDDRAAPRPPQPPHPAGAGGQRHL